MVEGGLPCLSCSHIFECHSLVFHLIIAHNSGVVGADLVGVLHRFVEFAVREVDFDGDILLAEGFGKAESDFFCCVSQRDEEKKRCWFLGKGNLLLQKSLQHTF